MRTRHSIKIGVREEQIYRKPLIFNTQTRETKFTNMSIEADRRPLLDDQYFIKERILHCPSLGSLTKTSFEVYLKRKTKKTFVRAVQSERAEKINLEDVLVCI